MSFKEIIAQESAVAFLKSVYRQKRMAHAYVFIGPDGVGKEKAALNFAKLLLCSEGKNQEPCDHCASCLKVDSLNHPDVQMVAPEGQFIKIDAIREACRRLSFRGFESKQKILIIRDAQQLNEESSNALLKTLEEPTGDTLIIVLVDVLKSILPTIASRCQRVVFSSLSEEKVMDILCRKYQVPKDAAQFLARFCEGSLGQALKFYQEGLFTRKNILLQDFLSKGSSLEDVVDLSSKERVEKQEQMEEALLILSSWFRDLLLAKACPVSAKFIHSDKQDDIMRSAGFFTMSQIEERLIAIAQTARDLKHNSNARIALTKLRVDLWK